MSPKVQPARVRRSSRPLREGPQAAPRPWLVTANALLLFLQGAGFLVGGLLYLGPLCAGNLLTREVLDEAHVAALIGAAFALLAMLAFVGAVGLLRLAHTAWLTAVLVQGASLLMALILYFRERPVYVYLIMLYGIIMVLYLHQADVQAAFRPKTEGAGREEHG